MTKTAETLKDLFAFIDDGCVEINFYGNDGFDNQEKVNGKELLKKYIQDAVKESANQFRPVWNYDKLQIDKLLAKDEAWQLIDVMRKLVEATDILLHKYNYDRRDYEEIEICVKRGGEIIEIIKQLPEPPKE